MKKIILNIGGMSCSACQNRVEKYLNAQNGVKASVNLVTAQALIEYDENILSIDDLNRFINESGYQSLGIYNPKEEKNDYSKYFLIFYGILGIVLMYVSMSHMLHLPVIPFLHMINHPVSYGVALYILTIPFIIYGLDLLKSGISKIFHLNPNMDSLVTIGILSSFIYSTVNLVLIIRGNNSLVENLYFESSAMIIYFVKLGRFIDNKFKNKTKQAIQELVQITPEKALLKTKDGEKVVTIDEVKKGDILICKPGMKIAVDGIIIKGESHIDEAFITGESFPSKKKEKEQVIAGSINLDGYIEYEAQKIGENSTISEIVRLVVEAINTKAPIAKLADTVSSYFVPGIIIIALATLVVYLELGIALNESIISFVTVLVVACPCALGLATPLAIVISEGNCAKKGILVKSSSILENACKVDTIIFDKTGTLTYGNIQISDLKNYSNYSDEELLNIVSSIEANSNHPIAKAFKSIPHNKTIKIFKETSGMGVSGKIDKRIVYIGNEKLLKKQRVKNKYEEAAEELKANGNSIIYVIEKKQIIGIIGIKDIIRDNVKETISTLKKLKKEIIMLSGDNEKTANIVAKTLDINKVIANVLPKEKENIIKQLQNDNHKVMMIGDGINDAPSISAADIGVSINSGTNIANDSADVILTNDDLNKIVDLLKVSTKTIKIIKQNLFWAFLYNSCMIPIAIGLLKKYNLSISPMMASIAMTLSSLCVILNSLRLKRRIK